MQYKMLILFHKTGDSITCLRDVACTGYDTAYLCLDTSKNIYQA